MPRMYNPDTQDVVEVQGRDVQLNLNAGYVVVGNRPEREYLGKTREEIYGDESEVDRQARLRSEPAQTIAEVQRDETEETRAVSDQRGATSDSGSGSGQGSRSDSGSGQGSRSDR